MNLNNINALTTSQYGFAVVHSPSKSLATNVHGLDLIAIKRVSLITNQQDSNLESVAAKLNQIWEKHQFVRIERRFFEAKAIHVIGPVEQEAEVWIYGRDAYVTFKEHDMEDQVYILTGMCEPVRV